MYPETKRQRPRYLILLLLVVVLACGYLFGLATAPAAETQTLATLLRDAFGQNRYGRNVQLIKTVLDEIDANYLNQPVDDQKMIYGALEGIVESLSDPYSVFLTPDETRKFEEVVEGSFEGIGAEIGITEDQLTIISPLKNSPAEKAGLQAGDFILAINDERTDTMTLDEAVAKLRGAKGTTVEVTLARGPAAEPQTVAITRDTIHIDSVVSEMKQTTAGDAVAYIQVNTFTGATDTEFADALQSVALKNPRGYIFDLRNNPGGFLDSAIDMLGHIIGTKVAVIEEFNDGKRLPHESDGTAELAEFPIVVLINKGSASASEIFAGALQDHGEAIILGAQTFGKGTVQNYEQLDDGSSLKITVARWLTPNGSTIEGKGITPDQVVELAETGDAQLEAALAAVANQCCAE